MKHEQVLGILVILMILLIGHRIYQEQATIPNQKLEGQIIKFGPHYTLTDILRGVGISYILVTVITHLPRRTP